MEEKIERSEVIKKGIFSWVRGISWSWIKSNWLTILIIVVIVSFFTMEASSMNGRVSLLNDVLNDKSDQITELQQTIHNLEEEQLRLNGELLAAQETLKRTTALFWSKFNKIKKESQNKTPEQILGDWQNTWPGGKK